LGEARKDQKSSDKNAEHQCRERNSLEPCVSLEPISWCIYGLHTSLFREACPHGSFKRDARSVGIEQEIGKPVPMSMKRRCSGITSSKENASVARRSAERLRDSAAA